MRKLRSGHRPSGAPFPNDIKPRGEQSKYKLLAPPNGESVSARSDSRTQTDYNESLVMITNHATKVVLVLPRQMADEFRSHD